MLSWLQLRREEGPDPAQGEDRRAAADPAPRRIGIVPVGNVDVSLLERIGSGLRGAFDADFTIESPGLDPRFAFHPERQQHHATEILARLAGLPGGESTSPSGQRSILERAPSRQPGPAERETGTTSRLSEGPPPSRHQEMRSGAPGLLDHASSTTGKALAHPPSGAWRVLGVTAVDLYIPILTFVFGEAQLEGPCAVVSYHRLRQELYGLQPDPPLLAERLLKEAVHELGHTMGLVHCPDWRCAMASSHDVARIDIKGTGFCAACRSAMHSPRPRHDVSG